MKYEVTIILLKINLYNDYEKAKKKKISQNLEMSKVLFYSCCIGV